jgi:hypothetical protein
MNTIRDSIPTEDIIRAYTDESVEIEEEVIIENIEDPEDTQDTQDIQDTQKNNKGDNTNINENSENKDELEKLVEKTLNEEKEKVANVVPSIQNIDNSPVITKLSFNDIDSVLDMETSKEEKVVVPKDIDKLEELSVSRAIQRNIDDDSENERIKIYTDDIDLNSLDIFDINKEDSKIAEDLVLDDIEEI